MNRALILLIIAAASSVAFAQTPCEQLQSLRLPDTTITMVTAVPAGAFVSPAAATGPLRSGRKVNKPAPAGVELRPLSRCCRLTAACWRLSGRRPIPTSRSKSGSRSARRGMESMKRLAAADGLA